MTDKKIGVGIVGLTPGRSWAATAHVPALRALPTYELIGVANSSLESAQRAAEACGLPHAFPNATTLARDPAVDLVAITVKVPYARFAEGPAAADPLPDFAAAVKHHRLLDTIERAATTGNRIRL